MTFKTLLIKYANKYNFDPQKEKDFKWQIGKIDKEIQTRYTPIYDKAVGIYNKKLVNEATFYKLWDQKWEVSKNQFY